MKQLQGLTAGHCKNQENFPSLHLSRCSSQKPVLQGCWRYFLSRNMTKKNTGDKADCTHKKWLPPTRHIHVQQVTCWSHCSSSCTHLTHCLAQILSIEPPVVIINKGSTMQTEGWKAKQNEGHTGHGKWHVSGYTSRAAECTQAVALNHNCITRNTRQLQMPIRHNIKYYNK